MLNRLGHRINRLQGLERLRGSLPEGCCITEVSATPRIQLQTARALSGQEQQAAAGAASSSSNSSNARGPRQPSPFGSLRTVATMAAAVSTAAAFWVLSDSQTSERRRQQQSSASPPPEDPLLAAVVAQREPQEAESSGLAQSQQSAPAASTASSSAAPMQRSAVSSSSSSSSSGHVPGPWITDDTLAEAMQRRALAENRLRGYLHMKQKEVQRWLDQVNLTRRMSQEEFEKEMLRIEEEVNLQTNVIMYGIDDPNARRIYLQKYGCSKWSEKALRTIAAYSPIVEIGAGLGHWQRELAARGADVLAFDNMSALPLPDVRTEKPEFVGKVQEGDEAQLSKHSRRTLLLVYPGPDDMAFKALQKYKGSTLLYVGESSSGVNASPEFFAALEKDWECVAAEDVEPFAEGYEKLWVLRRKKKSARGWLW